MAAMSDVEVSRLLREPVSKAESVIEWLLYESTIQDRFYGKPAELYTRYVEFARSRGFDFHTYWPCVIRDINALCMGVMIDKRTKSTRRWEIRCDLFAEQFLSGQTYIDLPRVQEKSTQVTPEMIEAEMALLASPLLEGYVGDML